MANFTDPGDDMSEVQIAEFTPAPALVHLLAERDDVGSVLVLPRTVDGDLGVYRETDLVAVKTLRHQGVPVDFLHPAHRRTFQSEYSAELVMFLAVFVAEALAEQAIQDLAKHLWNMVRRATSPGDTSPPRLTVEINRYVADGNRRELEGVRISGQDAKQVAKVVERTLLLGLPPSEED